MKTTISSLEAKAAASSKKRSRSFWLPGTTGITFFFRFRLQGLRVLEQTQGKRVLI